MKKRITALTLSVLLLLLSACSEKGGNTEETAASAAAGEDPAVTAEEETAWIDTLPAEDFGGITFNIAWSTPNLSWNEIAPDADEIAGIWWARPCISGTC